MYHRMVILVRRGLLMCEDIIHVMVAVFLLIATAGTVVYTFYCFKDFTPHSILTLISNALLILIIKEVLWTVIKFLKREPFTVSPFLFIGVISSVRQILFLEVQKSLEGNHTDLAKHGLELGINTGVILLLTISYYIVVKADKMRRDNKRLNQKMIED